MQQLRLETRSHLLHSCTNIPRSVSIVQSWPASTGCSLWNGSTGCREFIGMWTVQFVLEPGPGQNWIAVASRRSAPRRLALRHRTVVTQRRRAIIAVVYCGGATGGQGSSGQGLPDVRNFFACISRDYHSPARHDQWARWITAPPTLSKPCFWLLRQTTQHVPAEVGRMRVQG